MQLLVMGIGLFKSLLVVVHTPTPTLVVSRLSQSWFEKVISLWIMQEFIVLAWWRFGISNVYGRDLSPAACNCGRWKGSNLPLRVERANSFCDNFLMLTKNPLTIYLDPYWPKNLIRHHISLLLLRSFTRAYRASFGQPTGTLFR